VQYLGAEDVNGTQAVKLQLTPKDPAMAKSAPKVLLWIDMSKGIAVKQQRYDGDGNYLVFTYSNLRLNAKPPANAFEIKTGPGTQTVNH
jgi:outer membrane lipoprotein-sorting protein